MGDLSGHNYGEFYAGHGYSNEHGNAVNGGYSSSSSTSSKNGIASTSAAISTGHPSGSAQPVNGYRKSCQHCRKRKIRCIPCEPDSGKLDCKACAMKKQDCIFEKQSTMGRPPKNKPKESTISLAASTSKKRSQPSSTSPTLSYEEEEDNRQKKPRMATASMPSIGSHHPADSHSSYPSYTDHHHHTPSHSTFPYSSILPTNHATSVYNAVDATPLNIDNAMEVTSISQLPESSLSSIHNPSSFNPSPFPFSTFVPEEDTPLYSTTSRNTLHQMHHLPTHLPSILNLPSGSNDAKALVVQTEADPYPFFRTEPIYSLASAFHSILTSPAAQLSPSSTPVLSDPRIAPLARIRTLSARATSTRKPVDRGPNAATPNYARSLITPLWDGLPVDIISLTTTGKPSASGPFSITSEASKRSSLSHSGPAHEEYLYAKLLREDESVEFRVPTAEAQLPSPSSTSSNPGASPLFPKNSPGYRYAPDKTTIGKYFMGYFSKHPLAPLIINERLFLDDLMNNQVDNLLLHVIVGSAIARAPCLGAGDDDAEDIGEEFFQYIESELLSRQLDGWNNMQTCQALLLWATHELSHMRARRANALFNTAEVLLRQRSNAFQSRMDAENAYNQAQQEGRDLSHMTPPVPLGWRDLVEQELAVNALWVLVIWSTWTSLSLRLPHNTTSILTTNLPSPPQSVPYSSSFAYAYSSTDYSSPLQPIVRRTIERFSDTAQLINVIVTLKNQAQAKNLFTPTPPRPLAVIDDDEAHISGWLVDLARFYKVSEASPASLQVVTAAGRQSLDAGGKLSESSRAFLVVSHAVLSLHQILPYATGSNSQYGSPLPLPTVDSLHTALQALHLMAGSIQISAPHSRTRTQAILLDAMPRVLSLLDIFTTSSLSSLDHFVMLTTQRAMVHELLEDLNRAVASMAAASLHTRALESCASTLEKASRGLRTVVDIGNELQSRQAGQQTLQIGMNGPSSILYSGSDAYQYQSASTPTSSTSTDTAQALIGDSYTTQKPSGHLALNKASEISQYMPNTFGTGYSGPSMMYSQAHGGNDMAFGPSPIFSMSSQMSNSPLLDGNPDLRASSMQIGSLHAYL